MTEDLQAQHNAIWQPILAAHRVAAALRTIAGSLPALTAQASDPLYDLFEDALDYVDLLNSRAAAIEAAAPLPIEPTEDDYEAQFDRFRDMDADETSKDRVHALLEQMTEADKAEEIAQAALDELLDSDNSYDNGTHSNDAWSGQ